MPPTYGDGLVLLSTFLRHDSLVREAVVTYALLDDSADQTATVWAQFAQDEFADAWKASLDNQVAITQTTAIKGDGTEVFTTGVSSSAPVYGTGSKSSLPPSCALLIKKSTGLGGRKQRGRCYIPWTLAEGLVDEVGHIDNGERTNMQNAANAWLAALSGTGYFMALAGRTYDRAWNIPNRVLLAVENRGEVTSLLAEPVIATQRRRMPRA